MRLTFAQSFPSAAIEDVWKLVTDPESMNTWSTAKITSLSPGAMKTYNSVGALRRVKVRAFARTTVLDEVIEESEPPHRLVYRVYHGAPVRFHRGEMTLTKDADTVRFKWDVDLEGPKAILATLRFLLEREVGKSVRAMPSALAQLSREPSSSARRAPVTTSAIATPDAADLAARVTAAKNTLQRQADLSTRLQQEGSPHYWFARVYEFVSEEQIAFLGSRDCKNPAWVAALVPAFFAYYERNLRTHVEKTVPAEKHWQKAFGRAEHYLPSAHAPGDPPEMAEAPQASSKNIARAILHGAKAHIEGDLPRAIAEISTKEFTGVPIEIFRPDYALMGSLFRRAANRVFLEAAHDRPFDLRMQAYRVMPKAIRTALFAEGPYNIPEARMKAFEEAIRLASPSP